MSLTLWKISAWIILAIVILRINYRKPLGVAMSLVGLVVATLVLLFLSGCAGIKKGVL